MYNKLIFLCISNNQALKYVTFIVIIYSVMIQYYSVECKHIPQMSWVHKTRKATVETILKQL